MKKIIHVVLLAAIVLVSACRKSDVGNLPEGMVYLNQPHIVKESGDPAILDTDPLGFSATFSVDLYHENSEKPDHLDIVIVKNGDTKNAKVIQAAVKTFPAQVEITGQMLTELFGTIVSGDSYDVGADYVKGGVKYVAFPEGGGAAYGPGVSSQPNGASPTVRYSAICGFIADDFAGEYEITVDGWGDYGIGATTIVKVIDETTLAIESAIPSFNDVVIKVNDSDNTVVVDRQEAGDTDVFGLAYGMLFMTGAGGGLNNFVDPCTGTIRLNISYTVAAGSFGTFALELRKTQ